MEEASTATAEDGLVGASRQADRKLLDSLSSSTTGTLIQVDQLVQDMGAINRKLFDDLQRPLPTADDLAVDEDVRNMRPTHFRADSGGGALYTRNFYLAAESHQPPAPPAPLFAIPQITNPRLVAPGARAPSDGHPSSARRVNLSASAEEQSVYVDFGLDPAAQQRRAMSASPRKRLTFSAGGASTSSDQSLLLFTPPQSKLSNKFPRAGMMLSSERKQGDAQSVSGDVNTICSRENGVLRAGTRFLTASHHSGHAAQERSAGPLAVVDENPVPSHRRDGSWSRSSEEDRSNSFVEDVERSVVVVDQRGNKQKRPRQSRSSPRSPRADSGERRRHLERDLSVQNCLPSGAAPTSPRPRGSSNKQETSRPRDRTSASVDQEVQTEEPSALKLGRQDNDKSKTKSKKSPAVKVKRVENRSPRALHSTSARSRSRSPRNPSSSASESWAHLLKEKTMLQQGGNTLNKTKSPQVASGAAPLPGEGQRDTASDMVGGSRASTGASSRVSYGNAADTLEQGAKITTTLWPAAQDEARRKGDASSVSSSSNRTMSSKSRTTAALYGTVQTPRAGAKAATSSENVSASETSAAGGENVNALTGVGTPSRRTPRDPIVSSDIFTSFNLPPVKPDVADRIARPAETASAAIRPEEPEDVMQMASPVVEQFKIVPGNITAPVPKTPLATAPEKAAQKGGTTPTFTSPKKGSEPPRGAGAAKATTPTTNFSGKDAISSLVADLVRKDLAARFDARMQSMVPAAEATRSPERNMISASSKCSQQTASVATLGVSELCEAELCRLRDHNANEVVPSTSEKAAPGTVPTEDATTESATTSDDHRARQGGTQDKVMLGGRGGRERSQWSGPTSSSSSSSSGGRRPFRVGGDAGGHMTSTSASSSTVEGEGTSRAQKPAKKAGFWNLGRSALPFFGAKPDDRKPEKQGSKPATGAKKGAALQQAIKSNVKKDDADNSIRSVASVGSASLRSASGSLRAPQSNKFKSLLPSASLLKLARSPAGMSSAGFASTPSNRANKLQQSRDLAKVSKVKDDGALLQKLLHDPVFLDPFLLEGAKGSKGLGPAGALGSKTRRGAGAGTRARSGSASSNSASASSTSVGGVGDAVNKVASCLLGTADLPPANAASASEILKASTSPAPATAAVDDMSTRHSGPAADARQEVGEDAEQMRARYLLKPTPAWSNPGDGATNRFSEIDRMLEKLRERTRIHPPLPDSTVTHVHPDEDASYSELPPEVGPPSAPCSAENSLQEEQAAIDCDSLQDQHVSDEGSDLDAVIRKSEQLLHSLQETVGDIGGVETGA
eukprot:CAMPEP_0178986626 /NCGR_PEP_ID=MMETSP0795-20121207/2807_1 /TAXON_ID=88552 /ORGANISM="Amoebophrya sp., Strain Ameob2" /LENGTH=1302 /DNA_ID=CAMNT_0020677705 /DNA_START=55 /DNA_END=3963 /DNA_ORIENTATION=+